MFKSDEKTQWFSSFFLCIAAGAAAIAVASPAVADYRRSCHFVVEVNPTDTGLEHLIYSFRIFNTVEHRRDVNDARRVIRQRGRDCVLGHWNDRSETRPYACQDWNRVDMSQYPFDNIYEKIRQDICEANRDELRLPVNIDMAIRGKRGCLEWSEERGVVDPAVHVDIAQNFQFNCPVGEGQASERGERPPAGEGQAFERAERPPAGEGQAFERAERPPEEKSAREMGAPRTPPLPNTRLPGMDIGSPQPVDNWQECWSKCQEEDTCESWTFRPAGTWGRAEAMCLLKSGVPTQVSDSCCQSGTKN